MIRDNTWYPPSGVLTPEQVARIRCRPVAERLPVEQLPRTGDRIGVRTEEGGHVVAAVVLRVQSCVEPFPGYSEGVWPPGPDQLPDPNVWRVVTDARRIPVPRPGGLPGYLYELVDDPWPDVEVRIDPPVDGRGRQRVKRPRRFLTVREERLRGGAGWLPAGAIDDPGELAEPPPDPPPPVVPVKPRG